MTFFKLGISATFLGALALIGSTMVPSTADARPQYRKNFTAKYPDLAEKVKKVRCGVCHPPGAEEKKKARNNYGQALRKALDGKKNVADMETIMKALTKIESEKSAAEGKTFGDLIKAGMLPGKNEE